MQVFANISVSNPDDLDTAVGALVDYYDDSVDAAAVKELLQAGQVVMPAQFVLEVRDVLAENGVTMSSELTPTVGVPGSELELALPEDHRASTMIARLLGEQEGDIPISAVYDLLDLMTAITPPDSKEETEVVGEVLARAVLGVTGQIPLSIRLAAGIVEFQNAYAAKLSAPIDPDVEEAPPEE